MIEVDEARALIRGEAGARHDPETIPLARALGRVLAGPLRTDRDDPPCDRSMMDGFAVRARETPGRLEVSGRIAAGGAGLIELAPGCAAWINTGAPVPLGADAVVPVERTRGEVEVLDAVLAQANILARGSLARQGEVVAEGRLTPERIAVCAACGAQSVTVVRRPSVALLCTGSELRAEPGPHEIRNSNGPLLRALLHPYEVLDLGVCPDDATALHAALERGLGCEVLITTGGVSKGELDFVRPALERHGVEIVLHGVALQPGKPLLFGRHPGGTVFGLPGNPVSALVCADLFLLPYLAACSGRGFDELPAQVHGRLRAPVKASASRRRVFPCVVQDSDVDPLPWRSSADLYTLARGNAYMVVEAGRDAAAGDEVVCLVPER